METQRRNVLLGIVGALSACAAPVTGQAAADSTSDMESGTVYQTSTIDALSCGHFKDTTTIGELLENGGFGLGTVNDLNGELAVFDDTAYAVRGDGTGVELDSSVKTPFATVTDFNPDKTIELNNVGGYREFCERVTQELPRTDHFHALNVEGTFEYVRTRSVDEQIKPYPTLEEAIENETIFEFTDVEGDMPTFFIPDQFEGIHPPNYHSHFITAGRDGGGHVYDLAADSLTVEVDRLGSVEIDLPMRDVEEYPPC